MSTALRTMDPAADVDPDPHAPEAQEMLRRILAQPAAGARRGSSLRRVAVGGVLVGAAATAALVLPIPWDGHGPGLGGRAWAVVRHGDGSVGITVRWSELSDPAALQNALDRAGARTRILVGTETGAVPDEPSQVPACAKPYSGRPYNARAVQWDFPKAASEVNGIVIRPHYFPHGGTFVIEAYSPPGQTSYAPVLSFMAVGAVPSCAYPQ